MTRAVVAEDRIQQNGAVHRVAEAIRDQIVSGALVADQVLIQSSIARELGVSRIPVREAFQVLAAEGLLRIKGGQGSVTAISIDELQEIYEIREAIEPLATRIGLARSGRAQIMVMEQLLTELVEVAAAQDIRRWVQANAAFHRQLFAQSRRRRMIDVIDRLTRETDRYIYLSKSWGQPWVNEEHRRILEAARANDADELERATLDHLRSAHETILRYMLEHETDNR